MIYNQDAYPYRVWWYILKDFFFSFVLSLLFFITVFVANQVLLLAKDILKINVPFGQVALLLLYSLPKVISLAIPYSVLIASLVSLGYFSSFNEFISMRAHGISLYGIITPYITLAIAFVGFAIFTDEVLVPYGTIQYTKQYRNIIAIAPQIEIQSRGVKRFKDEAIVISRVDGDTIYGISILDRDSENKRRVLQAESGRILEADTNGIVAMQLFNVTGHSVGGKVTEFDYIVADSVQYNFLLKDITVSVGSVSTDSIGLTDLIRKISSHREDTILVEESKNDTFLIMANYSFFQKYDKLLEKSNGRNRTALSNAYANVLERKFFKVQDYNYQLLLVVIHKKFVFISATILFILLAFPLGLFSKRSGRSVGFGVGLIVSFLFWTINFVNQSVAINAHYKAIPYVMWYPNMLILIVAMILITRKARE